MPIPKHCLSADGDATLLPSAAHETWFRNMSCGGGNYTHLRTLIFCGRASGFGDECGFLTWIKKRTALDDKSGRMICLALSC